MATRDSPRKGLTTRSTTTLGGDADAANARVPAEDGEKRGVREQRVAKRRAMVEACKRELQATQDAWWRLMLAALITCAHFSISAF